MNSAPLDAFSAVMFVVSIGVPVGIFMLAAKVQWQIVRVALQIFGALLLAVYAWNIAVSLFTSGSQ